MNLLANLMIFVLVLIPPISLAVAIYWFDNALRARELDPKDDKEVP